MSLFSRSSDLPGLVANARDCQVLSKGLKKLSAGDIAVIDEPDISRAIAQKLIDSKPAAVINAAQFSTGSIPNFGPQLMLDESIMLVDAVGAEIWAGFKDGKKLRVTDDGGIYSGDKLIASGTVINMEKADAVFQDAQQSLVDHMEAYFGNTIQFIHSESPLLIDGLGVPESGESLRDKKVLVVSPGVGHRAQVKDLRNFIREYSPALIGVGEAADTLVELGYKPDFVVGDPSSIGAETLRSGAKVVLPAEPDGHAPGLDRIQDLGVGAMTFPAAVDDPTDLALLLADYHGAELVVNAGSSFDLDTLFAAKNDSSPATLLTRTKLGSKLVDASSIISLYTVRTTGGLGWLWALLGILVALAVIVVIVGTSGDAGFNQNLVDTWNNLVSWLQGLF